MVHSAGAAVGRPNLLNQRVYTKEKGSRDTNTTHIPVLLFSVELTRAIIPPKRTIRTARKRGRCKNRYGSLRRNANALAVVILSRTCAVRRCIERASKRIAVRVNANASYKCYGVEVRIEVEMRTLAFAMHNCGRNRGRSQNACSRQCLTRTVSKLDRRYS